MDCDSLYRGACAEYDHLEEEDDEDDEDDEDGEDDEEEDDSGEYEEDGKVYSADGQMLYSVEDRDSYFRAVVRISQYCPCLAGGNDRYTLRVCLVCAGGRSGIDVGLRSSEECATLARYTRRLYCRTYVFVCPALRAHSGVTLIPSSGRGMCEERANICSSRELLTATARPTNSTQRSHPCCTQPLARPDC